MGATNDIKETNITLKLVGLTCNVCSEKFTEAEIRERNYDLWFDTTNEVKLEELNKEQYYLSLRIRSIEHLDCPEKEENYDK